MALSNAERQRIWRERHRGEPRGNKVLMAKLGALKQERDELAERLAMIEAYQPGITAKARVWVARVDAAPGGGDGTYPTANAASLFRRGSSVRQRPR